MHQPLKSLAYAAMMGILSTNAHSAGFSLYIEDNGSAVGNFGAGLAAEAADASTGWYNPAGLVLIPTQELVGGGVGIFPYSSLAGRSTFRTVTTSPRTPVLLYTQDFNDLHTRESAFVPSLHYALPWGDRLTFGLSLISPFGLATDWGNRSAVRYQATRSDLMTINLSPQVGLRVCDQFSVGAGLDLQYAKVTFNSMLGVPTALLSVRQPPNRFDSSSDNQGKSYGVGFHAGVLGMFNDNATRVGLNYQSKMRHRFHGTSNLSGYLAVNDSFGSDPPELGTFTSSDLSTDPILLPDIVTLSGYQAVNDRLAILASAVYTHWSVFDVIQLNRVAAVEIDMGTIEQTTLNVTSPQHYRDAWRLALGANYCLDSRWMLRVGGGYDQTPTNDIDRDVRLPDSSRWGLSIGAHYQYKPNFGIDVGYTHLFSSNSQVNRTDRLDPTSTYNVTATGHNYGNLIGAQFVWMMDEVAVVDDAPMKD